MTNEAVVIEPMGAGPPCDTELFAGYPDLMTPTHIAKLTGFTVQYVRRLCRTGKLPAVRVGTRDWFIPKVKFISFVIGGKND